MSYLMNISVNHTVCRKSLAFLYCELLLKKRTKIHCHLVGNQSHNIIAVVC